MLHVANAIFFSFSVCACVCASALFFFFLFRLSSKLAASFCRLGSDLAALNGRQRGNTLSRKRIHTYTNTELYWHTAGRAHSHHNIYPHLGDETVRWLLRVQHLYYFRMVAMCRMSKCRCLRIGQHIKCEENEWHGCVHGKFNWRVLPVERIRNNWLYLLLVSNLKIAQREMCWKQETSGKPRAGIAPVG